jgi:nitrogen regulatory protein PII-like uncharacterized protein
MWKNIALAAVVVLSFVSCSSTITKEKYVDVMSSIGCKDTNESTPEGLAVMKEKGVTPADIATFRKKMDPDKIMEIVNEIAKRVYECHGIKK